MKNEVLTNECLIQISLISERISDGFHGLTSAVLSIQGRGESHVTFTSVTPGQVNTAPILTNVRVNGALIHIYSTQCQQKSIAYDVHVAL